MATLPFHETRAEVSRRLALAAEPRADNARGPRILLLLREILWPLEVLKHWLFPIKVEKARQPRRIMLLPGFGAHPLRLRWMARQLEKAGHTAKSWGMGTNLGATRDCFCKAEQRMLELYERRGEPLVLVGWSLGGVLARELAKKHPHKIEKVITMGSPFSGSPRANNGWRAYQAIAGHRVDEPEFDAIPSEKPPVETVAFWSPRDGVVAPKSACGKPGERDRAISVRCSHMGFVISTASVGALLSELDRGSSL